MPRKIVWYGRAVVAVPIVDKYLLSVLSCKEPTRSAKIKSYLGMFFFMFRNCPSANRSNPVPRSTNNSAKQPRGTNLFNFPS